MALCRTFRVTLALLSLCLFSACVSGSGAPGTSGTASQPPELATGGTSQPRMATYSCADGGMMTIENLGTSIRLLGPDGAAEELPAAPSNQRSRYGEAHDAIVIDGREALVMKGGQIPLNCTR